MGGSPVGYSILPRNSDESEMERRLSGSLTVEDSDVSKTVKIPIQVFLRVGGLLMSMLCLIYAASGWDAGAYQIAAYTISMAVHATDILAVGISSLRATRRPNWNPAQIPKGWQVAVVIRNPITGETKDWLPFGDQSPKRRAYPAIRFFFDAALIILTIIALVPMARRYYYAPPRHYIAAVGSLAIIFHFCGLLLPFIPSYFIIVGGGIRKPATPSTPVPHLRQEVAEQYQDEPTGEETARTTVDV